MLGAFKLNAYDVLGVDVGATEDDIREQGPRCAVTLHLAELTARCLFPNHREGVQEEVSDDSPGQIQGCSGAGSVRLAQEGTDRVTRQGQAQVSGSAMDRSMWIGC